MKKLMVGVAAVAFVGLCATGTYAQQTKGGAAGGGASAGGATGAASPGGNAVSGAPGSQGAGGNGSDIIKPGGAQPVQTGTGDGAASPGMKPNADKGTPAASGQRRQGENAGVAPGTKPAAESRPANGETGARPAQNGEAGTRQGQNGQAGQPKGGARSAPRLSGEQQTHVRQAFHDVHVSPVRVDFHIGIGVAVPRTVVLEPLPPSVITYVPEYEGYRFFVVPGQIVVVDPDTFEIVAVLPL